MNTLALLSVSRLAEIFPTLAKTWICALHIIWRHHVNYTIRVLELDCRIHPPCLGRVSEAGKLLYAYKNVRNMEKFLEDNAHAPDGTQPILARETMA